MCCWGLLSHSVSRNVVQGWPVSKSIESIFRHRSLAKFLRLKWVIFPGGKPWLQALGGVTVLKRRAEEIVKIWTTRWREECPFCVFEYSLHKEIRNPVRCIHVVSPTTVVTSILSQFQKLSISMCHVSRYPQTALALTALVYSHWRCH